MVLPRKKSPKFLACLYGHELVWDNNAKSSGGVQESKSPLDKELVLVQSACRGKREITVRALVEVVLLGRESSKVLHAYIRGISYDCIESLEIELIRPFEWTNVA